MSVFIDVSVHWCSVFVGAALFWVSRRLWIFVARVFPLLIGLACIDIFPRSYVSSHGLCIDFSIHSRWSLSVVLFCLCFTSFLCWLEWRALDWRLHMDFCVHVLTFVYGLTFVHGWTFVHWFMCKTSPWGFSCRSFPGRRSLIDVCTLIFCVCVDHFRGVVPLLNGSTSVWSCPGIFKDHVRIFKDHVRGLSIISGASFLCWLVRRPMISVHFCWLLVWRFMDWHLHFCVQCLFP